MHNNSYENEFNLHVNEISFSYEKMGTKTRFEKEAKGNSEMAYSVKMVAMSSKPKCMLLLSELYSFVHPRSQYQNTWVATNNKLLFSGRVLLHIVLWSVYPGAYCT